MASQNLYGATEYEAEGESIARRRRLAEALAGKYSQPVPAGQMVGKFYVPTSPFSHLAQALNYRNAMAAGDASDQEGLALARRQQERRGADMGLLVNALGGRPAQPGGLTEDASGNVTQADPIAAQTPAQSLRGALPMIQDPQVQQAAMGQLMAQIQRDQAEPTRVDLGDKIGLFKNGALVGYLPKGATPDATLRQAGEDRRHATPSGSAQLSAQTTLQTHATPSGSAQLSATTQRQLHATPSGSAIMSDATTRRGQDMTDFRAAEANARTAGDKSDKAVTDLRKEFDDVPEVKNYRAVLPIIESARKAPNTPAGDLDLIYAVGKVLDPTSVVREGEMALVIKSGSPMERFKGQVQYIMQGKGRLTEQNRAELTAMLGNRVGQLEKGYNDAKAVYERAATARGLPFDQIFRESVEGSTPAYGRRESDRLKLQPDGSYVYTGGRT